jgi:AcrR family transcriptional regulator
MMRTRLPRAEREQQMLAAARALFAERGYGAATMDEVAAAVAEAEEPADALELGVRAFLSFVDRDRDAWRVLFDETLPAGGEIARRVAEHRDQLEGLVARILVSRLPRAGRRRAAIEVEALSTALLGAAESLARWWLRTGALSAGEAAELLIETVEPGLRARTTGGRV